MSGSSIVQFLEYVAQRYGNKPIRAGVYSPADPPRGYRRECRIVGFDQVSDTMSTELSFMAMLLTIKAGAVVTWTNTDEKPRIVWSDRGSTRSTVDTDGSMTFTFDKPGTYHFTCSIHPRMIVTVVVE